MFSNPHFTVAPLAVAAAAAYLGNAQVQPVTQRSEPKSSEPMFNVPPVVIATVAVLVLVHAFRMFALADAEDMQFLLTFAFIPARYDTNLLVGGSFPGGFGADLWTFFTYAFLHADLLHIGLNLAWLLPFGTALARRFGAWRYVVFMLVTAAAGALAHLASHPGAMVPMIGASAAISGRHGGGDALHFPGARPARTVAGGRRQWRGLPRPGPAAHGDVSRRALPAVPRVWIGLNALFGLGTVSFGEEGQQLAWQAHIGGFFAGLLLFTAFDPVAPRGEFDTEPSG